MFRKKYGDFELSFDVGGYPVWIEIKCRDGEHIYFTHGSIADLEHVCKVAKRKITNKLPNRHKGEV